MLRYTISVFLSSAYRQAGVFHYGRIRRSDWLPVDGTGDEQTSRSADSLSDDDEFDEVDRELEELYSGSESELGSEVDYWEQLHESEDDGWDLSEGSGSDCEPPPFVLEAGEAGPSDLGGLV